MKKNIFLLLIAIMLFSVFAFAEEEIQNKTNETNQIDELNKDLKYVEIMNTPHGAIIRLLQLQKNIIRNILHGEQILKALDNKNITYDKRMDEILTELKSINTEISKKIENINTSNDETNQELVIEFVDLKSKAINLTKEFKNNLKNLSDEEKERLRQELKKKSFEEVEKIENKVRNAIKELNKKRTMYLFNNTNINLEDLKKEIEEKNLTSKEIKNMVKERLKTLNITEKKNIIERFNKEREKIEIRKQIALNTRLRLDKNENVDKVKEIMQNPNLTIEEKKAKVNILIEEKIKTNKEVLKEKKEILNNLKEIREQEKERNRIRANNSKKE
ncbi:MAG: hypothetical protein QXE31_01510 [Candidatus Woesearchaeota archaeon]